MYYIIAIEREVLTLIANAACAVFLVWAAWRRV